MWRTTSTRPGAHCRSTGLVCAFPITPLHHGGAKDDELRLRIAPLWQVACVSFFTRHITNACLVQISSSMLQCLTFLTINAVHSHLPRNLTNFHWEDGSTKPTTIPRGKGFTGPGYSRYGFFGPQNLVSRRAADCRRSCCSSKACIAAAYCFHPLYCRSAVPPESLCCFGACRQSPTTTRAGARSVFLRKERGQASRSTGR